MCNNFYVINNFGLATTIKYLYGISYKVQGDRNNSDKRVYVFKNDNNLKKALTEIKQYKKSINQ